MDAVELLEAVHVGQVQDEHVNALVQALREHLMTGISLDAALGLDGEGDGPWGSPCNSSSISAVNGLSASYRGCWESSVVDP